MRYYSILILLLNTSFAFSQDADGIKSFSAVISIGESLAFEEKSIKFGKVVSDSRCPQNVTCIWAGEAKVMVEVYDNEKFCGTEILTLAAGAKLPQFLQRFFPDQNIALSALKLSPYPVVGQEIDPLQYTLDMYVEVSTGGITEK